MVKGETDLATLLASMSPALQEGEYVFCSFKNSCYGDHSELQPLAAYQEKEGLTLVIPRSRADDRQLEYTSTYRVISLGVHSSLEAVGLTAAFATKLADHGISANVFAGYYHDHVFVDVKDAEQALLALQSFSTG